MVNLQKVAFGMLIPAASAGTFKLYDVGGGSDLVVIENKKTYDLNDLEVGENPQITVLYESDSVAPIGSVTLKIFEGDTQEELVRTSRECDETAPYYATSSGDDPVPFSFPMGENIKVLARLNVDAKCSNPTGRERIRFTLVNSFVGGPLLGEEPEPEAPATEEPEVAAADDSQEEPSLPKPKLRPHPVPGA